MSVITSLEIVFWSDSQTSPSENCCKAKMRGIQAKGRIDFFFAAFSVKIPMTPNTAAALKLAVAEKHMMKLQIV